MCFIIHSRRELGGEFLGSSYRPVAGFARSAARSTNCGFVWGRVRNGQTRREGPGGGGHHHATKKHVYCDRGRVRARVWTTYIQAHVPSWCPVAAAPASENTHDAKRTRSIRCIQTSRRHSAYPSASFRLPPPANAFLGPHFSDGKLAPSIAPRFLAFLWSSLPTPVGLFFSLAPASAWRVGGIWAPPRPGVTYGGGGWSPRPVRLGVMYAGGFPEPSRGLAVQGKPVAVAGVRVNRWWRRRCSRGHSVRNRVVAPHVEDVPLVSLSLGETPKS